MRDSVFRSLIERAPDPILVCGPDLRIEFVNQRAHSCFDWQPEHLVGQRFTDLCVPPFDLAVLQTGIQTGDDCEQMLALRHGDGSVSAAIVRRLAPDMRGDSPILALYLYPLDLPLPDATLPALDPKQQLSALLMGLRSYRHLALTDALTGLPNRRALDEALTRECARAARLGGFVSIIMLDLDRFKQINDRLGHVAGDEVLRRYAHFLRGLTRRSDFLGRYGGDEMLLIVPEIPEGAWSYAERLRVSIATQILEPAWGRTTLSAGIASKRPSTQDGAMLLEQADTMLYEAKRAGGNAVRLIAL
jgi:diguanylate cyclase (GGDEF)-like protein